MHVYVSVFYSICVIGLVRTYNDLNLTDGNVDPASLQLINYKERNPTPNLLTTSAGQPVYEYLTNTLNTNLLNNPFLLETIKHMVNEKIPDRVAFPKGAGARGYFEVTRDISKYTKAQLFNAVGKVTPVLVRFGIAEIEKGASDLSSLATKGLSVKFYTEQGNFDLISINIPVFLFRDPLLFHAFVKALRPNPKTNLKDDNAIIDFITMNPVVLHAVLWELSGFGLPRGFRHMNAFPCHTFELYNNQDSFFVRFKWLSDLGFKGFSLEEASAISSFDPDFFMRDLYNSIERKKYPSWTLEMAVLKVEPQHASFDPFDVTSLWPNGSYTTEKIGRLVLNQNVENYFAEVEQVAFNPSNLVPGIIEPPDQIFHGRVIAYADAQIHRLGINYNKIKANCPIYARTYNRDGASPVQDNEGGAVHYFPNYFHGPVPYIDDSRPKRKMTLKESNPGKLESARQFYNEVTKKNVQKQRLVENMAKLTIRARHEMQKRLADLLHQVDPGFADRYVETINALKRTVQLPKTVEEVDTANPNPFSSGTKCNLK